MNSAVFDLKQLSILSMCSRQSVSFRYWNNSNVFSYDCLQHWYNSNVIGTPVLPPTTSIDHVSIEKVTLNETRRSSTSITTTAAAVVSEEDDDADDPDHVPSNALSIYDESKQYYDAMLIEL
ncbi:hypothetical protein CU097_012919 [Rhizopus azygosporus]|uniref:Uncharacterized protein n=1 Tax=Rhizopus azygosporus TaxID=86630 RepID=A0A367K5X8_RHIAZ|nr:hypothetical protein CU097_012919 [Rhizopus azygosporus]